ncbi:amino acid ABC transporter permease [Nonomuraea muscovyensis]|jgi:glutamate transport system permease protein|uniref:Glutamate transport system permease protein n=1 Tax=Nonomuraea muscovyensis TaxID=1124761 RepID=A0A7X0EYA7_9ACTN|nr:amino acid ABC transporter permease [Nonomuraea muscovyensis]MBB6348947.1 glutamate transport system permease protein [Nonomuraea muscovyensis]MDF2707013.1 binding-protein-dependent transport system inner rane component [Nonomuraea muscovyensis]
MSVLLDHLPELWQGLVVTLQLTAASFLGAAVLGVIVTALRVSPVRVLRAIGTAYVETFQNLPLLVLLVLAFFGLPEIGVKAEPLTTAIVVVSVYEAAYVGEALRSGVNSVSKGQGEAARAIGLTFTQSLRHVILPQALRTVVQPLGNIAIALIMNTALAGAVSIVELTTAAKNVNLVEAQPIPIFVGAGIAYALLAALVGLVTGRLERRLVILR